MINSIQRIYIPYKVLFIMFLTASSAIMSLGCGNYEDKPYLWDSSTNTIRWQPQSENITISHVKGVSGLPESNSSLRIHGSDDSSSSYAVSDFHQMEEFMTYRLSVWMRYVQEQWDSSFPVLTLQFATSDPNSFLGKVAVENMSKEKAGEWQYFTLEFRSPLGTEQFRFSLERAFTISNELESEQSIDVYIENIIIEPIEQFTITDKYDTHSIDLALNKVKGVHPRIFLTKERIHELRKLIRTSHSEIWIKIQTKANNIITRNPPKYMDESEWANIEQLYMRPVGDNLPYLALAYRMTDEDKYLESAQKWALAACGYKTWGLYEFSGIDLAAGHMLLGLGILYDWCYDDLDIDTRNTIRDTIVRRGSFVFNAAASGRMVKDIEVYRRHPWPEWDEAYLQNHLWDNSCSLSIAGLAVFDEVDDVTQWLALTMEKFEHTMELLGDDGASHEGEPYWTYGIEYLLKFMDLARELLNVNMYEHDWFRNTAMYRLYMGLPQNSWSSSNTVVDYGDSPRYDWYGADYQLRKLAGEYRNGYAQWLADELNNADADHPVSGWLNLIWYDPTVMPKPPDDLPTMHHFEDIGLVTARSDWSGNESLLFFKCGPYIGHKAIQKMVYDHSSGHHVHPDTNHFMLFGNGEWLIRDDGYWAKYTGYHNTLIIDNTEQLGGGYPAFNGLKPHSVQARPRITRAISTVEFDHLTGNATESYPRNIGLRHYIRHLIFLKPDVLIVIDDIKLDETRELELRFHPEQQQAEMDGTVFMMRGKQSVLRLEPLTTDGLSVVDENFATLPKEALDDPGMIYTIRLMAKKSEWLNLTALSWANKNDKPAKVFMQTEGDKYTFTVGHRKIAFNRISGDVQYEK